MSTELINNEHLKISMFNGGHKGACFHLSLQGSDYIELTHHELQLVMMDIADCCLCVDYDGTINKDKVSALTGDTNEQE